MVTIFPISNHPPWAENHIQIDIILIVHDQRVEWEQQVAKRISAEPLLRG